MAPHLHGTWGRSQCHDLQRTENASSVLKKGTVPLQGVVFPWYIGMAHRDCPLFQRAAKGHWQTYRLTHSRALHGFARCPRMTDSNTNGARMIAACTLGDEATVRALLRETLSLACRAPSGPLAPLHYAVREGHAGIVQLLLEHGADAHVVVDGTLWGIPLSTLEV